MAENVLSKIRRFPKQLVLTIFAGTLAGVVAVSNTISYGASIFSGDLSQFIPLGIGLALFSGLVLTAAMALTSSYPGTIAFPKAATTPILALLAAQIAFDMPASADSDEIFITVAVALGISTLGMGLIFFFFGAFGLGRFIRFMPYPVTGGFMAGLGWLLLKGGFSLMADYPLKLEFLTQWLYPFSILRWAPGVLFAIVVLLLQRRYKNDVVIPLAFVLGLGIFHGIGVLNNFPVEKMAEHGLLLGTFTNDQLWDPTLILNLHKANWQEITHHVLTMMALIPTALISMLFNSSGIELATRKPINLNRELIASGFANILASFGGGIMGYQSASLSALSHKMGAHNRFVGIFAAAVFGLVLYFGSGLLSIIPKLLIGGLLIYLGLTFLIKWVFESFTLITKLEYITLLIILGVIVSLGLLQGVGVGVLATIVLFALNYSQIDIVRSSLSGSNFQSNVERDPNQADYLRSVGESICILKLQGFIFFGTAHNLQLRIEQRAKDKILPELKYVVLDFRFVSGVDSSALNSFIGMHHQAVARGYKLAFADMNLNVQRQLESTGILEEESQISVSFADIDYAVEWCESELIDQTDLTATSLPSCKSQIAASFPSNIDLDDFMIYLEEQIVEENTELISAGDQPLGIFFIERGQVTVQVELENGEILRLRTMGSGTVVGEIGAYLGRPATATVVTDIPSIIYILSIKSMQKMEEDDPHIASAFHKFMVELTTQRLSNTTTTLQAMLK